MRSTLAICLLLLSLTLLSCGDREAQYIQHMTNGDKYIAQEEYRSAISAFKAAVHLKPNSADAHFKLALALKDRLHQIDNQYGEYYYDVNQNPLFDFIESKNNEARWKNIKELENIYIKELHTVIKLDKNNLNAYLLLGPYAFREKDKNWMFYYNETFRIKPNNPETNFELGKLISNSNPSKAEQYFLKALKHRPDYSEALEELICIYPKLQKEKLVIPLCEEFVKTNPKNSYGYSILGYEYLSIKENTKAMAANLKAIELDDRNYKAHLDLSVLYKNSKDFSNAIKEYDKVIKLTKNKFYTLKASQGLFNANLNLGNYEEAIFQAKEMNKHSYNKIFNYRLANAYYYNKQYREAIQAYKNNFNYQRYPYVNYMISKCYLEMRQYNQALKYIDASIKETPDNKKYLGIKQQILAAKTKAEKDSKQK